MRAIKDPKKGKRRNENPQSPRFLPPAKMVGGKRDPKARAKAIEAEKKRVKKEERKARRKVRTVKSSRQRRGPSKNACNVSGSSGGVCKSWAEKNGF